MHARMMNVGTRFHITHPSTLHVAHPTLGNISSGPARQVVKHEAQAQQIDDMSDANYGNDAMEWESDVYRSTL